MLAQYLLNRSKRLRILNKLIHSDFLTPRIIVYQAALRLENFKISVKCHDTLSRANSSNIKTSRNAESNLLHVYLLAGGFKRWCKGDKNTIQVEVDLRERYAKKHETVKAEAGRGVRLKQWQN